MHEDYQLLSLLKNGDEKAVKGFYQKYKSEFFLFAKKYEIAAESILDIYQDAVIALCENARKGKLEGLNSSLKTYFFAIGKYMIFAKLKKENKTVSFEEIQDFHIEWETETEDDSEHKLEILRTVMNKMGGQCQRILTLFYYDEKKLDDITEIMNYESKDVAKSQKARCLKKLKELIKFES